MTSLKTYLFLVLCLSFSINSFGQYTEVINSNRPGVSRSAFSVGTNVVQFEIGPYLIKEERTPAARYEISGFGADFAVRYGLLFEELELNIEGTYQNDTQTYFTSLSSEQNRANFKSLLVGAKYMFFDPNRNAGEDKPNLYSYHANRGFKWKSLIPAIAVGAGVGYNKGKRFELTNTSRLQLPKATSTESISQQEVSINYGNYVEVDEYVGQFGIATNDRVLIMGSQFNSVSAANSSTYDISSNSVAAWTDVQCREKCTKQLLKVGSCLERGSVPYKKILNPWIPYYNNHFYTKVLKNLNCA